MKAACLQPGRDVCRRVPVRHSGIARQPEAKPAEAPRAETPAAAEAESKVLAAKEIVRLALMDLRAPHAAHARRLPGLASVLLGAARDLDPKNNRQSSAGR